MHRPFAPSLLGLPLPPPRPASQPAAPTVAPEPVLHPFLRSLDNGKPKPPASVLPEMPGIHAELEDAILAAVMFLARSRVLRDAHGSPVRQHEIPRYAGLRWAGASGAHYRLRPYLKVDHPLAAMVRQHHDALRDEEAYWKGVEREPDAYLASHPKLHS